jgi:hypothetical protein
VPCVRLRQRHDVLEQTVRLDELATHLAVLHERAQTADDFARTQRLRADVLLGGLVGRDEPLTRLRVRRDRRQRLIHFVRDARGHLAHRRDATEMRDAILHLAYFVLGAAPVGDVVERPDLAQHASVRPTRRLSDVVHVAQ